VNRALRILLLIIVVAISACENISDFSVDLENKTSLSFSFSGRSAIADFEILELPRTKPLSKTNPWSFKGETIWKIGPTAKLKGSAWPRIEYGVLPNGFSQTVPASGAPPTITAGKLYAARISDGTDGTVALFFELRNGRPVNVSDEVLGP
jgi:hypothetical protein